LQLAQKKGLAMKKIESLLLLLTILFFGNNCVVDNPKIHSHNDISENTVDGVNLFAYEKRNYPARPEIKNGTFYLNGKPKFLVGPWLNCRFQDVDEPVPLKGYDSTYYKKAFNYDMAEKLGFSTCQPQVEAFSFVKKILSESNKDIDEDWEYNIKYWPGFIRGLKQMPLVMDFAAVGLQAFKGARNREVKDFSADMFQQKKGWIVFVPFCPEHPLGKKIYETYWREGTLAVLAQGGNPWIYELFNEPTYDCRCLPNKIAFEKRLEDKYRTIENANKAWNSNFRSFEELIKNSDFERQRGLKVEWLKFIEDRWVEILQDGIKTIKKIDPRKKIYFSSQRNIWLTFLSNSNGFNEYKNARALDIINTEGCLNFTQKSEIDNNDPMSSHLMKKPQMHLDCCRAVAEGKPVIDTEYSTVRTDVNKKRLPSKRSDIVLALWVQAIHGSSLTELYSWTKQLYLWPTKDLKGAKALVDKAKHTMCGLLNPVCYPEDALKGIKDFEQEISQLSEIVLPTPRIKGQIALLLSIPSKRAAGSIEAQFENYYNALLSTHYPFDIIFEEQINKGMASKYQAIVSPASDYIYSETLENLKEYVGHGGVLFLNGMDMEYNEYGIPLNNKDFIGVEKRHIIKHPSKETINVEGLPNPFETEIAHKVVPCSATCLISGKNKEEPVLLANKYEKGTVYYTPRYLTGISLSSFITFILRNSSIEPPFVVSSPTGKPLPMLEAQIIDRGRTKLYFFANWRPWISELAVLKTKLPAGNYSLSDPTTKTLHRSPSGKPFWTSPELENGVKIIFPPEERVLLLISQSPPSEIRENSNQDNIVETFKRIREKEEIRQKEISEEIKKSKTEALKRNMYLDCDAARCLPLDISTYCNMGFMDRIAGDEKGGAFDEGDNDFRYFPTGERKFSNVPFKIVIPQSNDYKSMIVMRGCNNDFLPQEVKGIPVNKKAKFFYFLHASAGGGKSKDSFSYVANYADGSSEKIAIRNGSEIGDWWAPNENTAPLAKIAWEGKNPVSSHIGVYCYRWQNPRPEIEIKSIDIKTHNNKIIPGILGITLEN